LRRLIAADQARLERITGTGSGEASAPATASGPGTGPLDMSPPASMPGVSTSSATSPGSSSPPAGAGAPGAAPAGGASAPAPTAGRNQAGKPGAGGAAPGSQQEELAKAEAEAKRQAERTSEAERRQAAVAGRLDAIGRHIELEEKQLDAARRLADNAAAAGAEFTRQRSEMSPARAGERVALAAAVQDAQSRREKAAAEVEERSRTLERLRGEREFGAEAQSVIAESTARARRDLEAARSEVAQITNPFAPRNLLRWAVEHGPRIGAVIGLMLLVRWMVQLFGRRVVLVVAARGARGSGEEQLDRAHTLVGVF